MIKDLVYIKIHKCSSTSVRAIIEENALKNNLRIVKASGKKKHHFFLTKNKSTTDWKVPVPPYNVFARHEAYSPSFFNQFMDNPHYITFLRDPIERAFSSYYSPDVPPKKHLYKKTTFEQWYLANHKQLDITITKHSDRNKVLFTHNFMSYMCGFNNIEEITKENLLKRFKFIGFTETFDESINRLENILGWGKLKKHNKIKRINRRKPINNLGNEVIQLFKENNKIDYKFYNLAKQIY
jgi:hypothetical protein